MNIPLLISVIGLWALVLMLGFLMLGTLRSLGLLNWRLEQMEATRPSRVGRSGLAPGRKAPEFTLPDLNGVEGSLREYSGRPLLLVFVQTGCGPCLAIVPELNRLQHAGITNVLAINNAEPAEARRWAQHARPAFTVLVQERWEVSKKYEVFATPFAFLIDEHGYIAAAGIVNSRQHIGFLLDAADKHRLVRQTVREAADGGIAPLTPGPALAEQSEHGIAVLD